LSRDAGINDEAVTELLARLSAEQSGTAWREFVKQYSALIMHTVRRHENDHDRVSDCFLFVTAALSDDGFRRLLSYRPEGPARFRTWLMAVVSNLCIDWRRRQDGRIRPIQAVSRLPELDQLVYRHIYQRGLSRAQCLLALQPKFPDLTEQQLADINARLFVLLTPQQRFHSGVRSGTTVSLDGRSTPGESGAAGTLEEPGPGPDELALQAQQQSRLQAALSRLPPQQRLLLRLRFEQDLTLAEVARLTRQQDPFRANRQIQAALAALADLMEPDEPDRTAKPPIPSV
jgi:RNA polymerase sigma factor (sigma-70 family)